MASLLPRYPKTPYWPFSPNLDDASRVAVHMDPGRFVGPCLVVTEKLDGGNTLLHRGKAYGRSAAEARRKWMAMTKKHIAWKVQEPDVLLYGENIYAVHSIEYEPVSEDRTFYAFAMRRGEEFAPFAEVEAYAEGKGIPTVPVLFRGTFDSLASLRAFVRGAHEKPSVLGGDREGIVIRIAAGFPACEFERNVCKSVRPGHITTGDCWRRTWRPCRTIPPDSATARLGLPKDGG